MSPRVSFVVPCYNLGDLLPECVNSILVQSYEDFEVLIMDDCSPDNTPEVAGSFQDPRIKHIRNEPNLGHLKNYNKGIRLAKGEYIWLISADDRLRSPQVLQRYVRLMDASPRIGYVFCPSMKVVNGREAGVMPYSEIADHEMVIGGHEFLRAHLVEANIVPAPAAMARKKCYEQVSFFPLDLPHTGDWYLWGMFALYFDVGYFAEPMVSRRFHEGNMSSEFYKKAAPAMFANNLAVTLRIRERAKKEGFQEIADSCKRGISAEYLRQVTPPKANDPVQACLTSEEFEESLHNYMNDTVEEAEIRAQVYAGLGDHFYAQGDSAQALENYRRALGNDHGLLSVRAKYVLLRMGGFGTVLREVLSVVNRQMRKNRPAKV